MDRSGHRLWDTGVFEYDRLLALLDQRRFDEARVAGEVLLEQPETTPLTRARTHNLLCWIYVEGLKRPTPSAVLHGEESVRLAEALAEHQLAVQARCNLANACFQVADYDGAERCYHEVIRLLKGQPDLLSYGRVVALAGLAQIELVRGRADRSLERLAEAEALCADGEGQALLADLYLRRALTLLRMGRANLAAEALQQVEEADLVGGPRGLWWRTHLGIARAQVEAALGHLVNARVLTVNTIALARELGDLPVLAESTCLLATIEAREGRKEVNRRARAALTFAIQSGRRDVAEEVRHRLKAHLQSDL